MKPIIFIFICTSNHKTSYSESKSAKNSRQRGLRATDKGVTKMRAAKAAGLGDGQRLTNERLAEEANVSPKTVQRFLKGKGVDKDCAIAILNALNLEAQDILEDRNKMTITGL